MKETHLVTDDGDADNHLVLRRCADADQGLARFRCTRTHRINGLKGKARKRRKQPAAVGSVLVCMGLLELNLERIM